MLVVGLIDCADSQRIGAARGLGQRDRDCLKCVPAAVDCDVQKAQDASPVQKGEGQVDGSGAVSWLR